MMNWKTSVNGLKIYGKYRQDNHNILKNCGRYPSR